VIFVKIFHTTIDGSSYIFASIWHSHHLISVVIIKTIVTLFQ